MTDRFNQGDSRPTGRVKAIQDLMGDAISLYHRLRFVAEEVHRRGRFSSGRRGVLLGLAKSGPVTVPQMARARPVSRQYIQSLVNPLAAEGLLELKENPAHRASPLVALTQQGKDEVDRIRKREAELLSLLPIELTASECVEASRVLGVLREAFEGRSWKAALKRKSGVAGGQESSDRSSSPKVPAPVRRKR